MGVDWIVIDAEHGHLDWKEILDHIRAAVRSDTVVLVRIAELNLGRAVCQGMVDLSLGQKPKGVVNAEVFELSGFQAKWRRLCGAGL